MKKWFFFAVCFALLCTTPLFAGPRWWWNDAPIALTPQDSVNPDITLPIGTTTPVRAIIVVWQEKPAGETDNEIYLTASFDDGCSFCDPVQITNNDLDDLYPHVAAAVGAGTELRIQVAHEQVDPATTTHIIVTYNVNPLDTADLSCAALAATNWTKKQVDAMGTPHVSGRPDIAATVFNPTNPGGAAQFAVAWQENYPLSGGHDDILVAFDAVGNASYGAPVNVTNSPGTYDQRPAVIMSNGIPGVPPTALIGVAYVTGPGDIGSTAKQVMYDYSTNNGGAFAGPTPLNLTPGITAAALDAGVPPFGVNDTMPFWLGASWLTPGSTGNPAGVFFNAQLMDISRGGVVSPWVLPPENLFPTNGKSGIGGPAPAVAVVPYPASGSAVAFFTTWLELNNPTQSEVFYRAGVLDENGTPPIDINTFPLPTPQPSVNTQLTGITPPRTAGTRPDNPAVDAQSDYPPCDDNTVFVVYPDNSGGNYDIYFKRLDTCIVDPSFSIPPAACLPVEGLPVEWPDKNCPNAVERLTSIKVYYATVSGGPYTLGASVAGDAAGAQVPGLALDTDYYFVVLFEDEAGNTAPSPFDPSVHSDPPPRGETLFHTPAIPCGAALIVTKTWVDTDGGQLLPGDTVTGTITVENPLASGTPATDITVDDTVDANLQNIATPDADGVVAGSQITWTTGQTLQPDETLTRSFTADVKCNVGTPPAPIADLTQIPNPTFGATSPDTGHVGGSPPVALAANRPILSITKTETPDPVDPEGTVTYTIQVCNTGSAPETGVVIRDSESSAPPSFLDFTTVSFVTTPGTVVMGPPPYIEWTIPTIAAGSVGNPTCVTIEYTIEAEDTLTDETVCNFAEIFATSGVYDSCNWSLPNGVQACFTGSGGVEENHLLKSDTPVPPLPQYAVIPVPPATVQDTGLTDTTNPMVFYQVEQSTGPNSLKEAKNTTDADAIDISY
jgi:uncharacterized repeat protein (TIGR01451 family)